MTCTGCAALSEKLKIANENYIKLQVEGGAGTHPCAVRMADLFGSLAHGSSMIDLPGLTCPLNYPFIPHATADTAGGGGGGHHEQADETVGSVETREG